jgi:hypothetical protein
MVKLLDREGLAIFSEVAECRSFADAALGPAPVKGDRIKVVSRTEVQPGACLIVRAARRFDEPTSVDRAPNILDEGKWRKTEHGPNYGHRAAIRLAAPMSFGCSTSRRYSRKCLISRFPPKPCNE